MQKIRLFQSVQAKLIIIYVLLILIAMQLIGVYFIRTLESYFKNDFLDSRTKQAYLLAEYIEPYMRGLQEGKANEDKKPSAGLNDVINNLFAISKAEIQVIDANGIVITTTQQNHQMIVGQKNTQTEVSRALQGIKDNPRMFIDMDNIRKVVITRPIGSGAQVVGAVYIVASMEDIYNTMNSINKIFISGTLIALALTVGLGVILTHAITSPIKEITKQATAVAEGNFVQKVKIKGNDEIGQLGNTFNFMTAKLKEALSLNEEEKEKLASILANMNEGLLATDDQGQVIMINRRAKQMLLINEETALGKPLSESLGFSNEELNRLSSGEGQMVTLQVYNAEEDEEQSVKLSFTRIHSRGTGAGGTIVVLQDVTEQEKLELSRREFVANVSHELRTPLTTIKSYLEALEDGAIEEPQLAHKFVGVTRNETERMIRLVNDLLQLSRLDSKQVTISKEPTDVAEMLDEVVDRFSVQMLQRQIDIRVEVDHALGVMMLDRDRIDQVLDNLVSNAVKYTGEGGSISLRAAVQDAKWVEVTVQDNGIGIPKKDLNRIFDRFYRVDKARSRSMGGTGLGLSIAREIVKAHGGTIMLESELNQGTKVVFTLPYQMEENAAV
ncbi:cell wall metabolism sensor histidine kinase WalK [Paenibacillus thalictri]|uniref:histidine kinase n=1 Tax=Paenibacillus thalictri TaxID=2527873 RepID=A0A4Q9DQZ7_9BACL|nr:cell wall metabolism sensor histidine kinase WalK [Paenibacillus thalictri]TBL77441.1 cell wall metabolism sensor histidine kinase WalK [Paenibacillus thalictri]